VWQDFRIKGDDGRQAFVSVHAILFLTYVNGDLEAATQVHVGRLVKKAIPGEIYVELGRRVLHCSKQECGRCDPKR